MVFFSIGKFSRQGHRTKTAFVPRVHPSQHYSNCQSLYTRITGKTCHFRLRMSTFPSIFQLIKIALTSVGTFFPKKCITACIEECDSNPLCPHRSSKPPSAVHPRSPPPLPPLSKKKNRKRKENCKVKKKFKGKSCSTLTCVFFKIGSLWNVAIKLKESGRKERKRHKLKGH